MYISDHFRESDSDAINALIRHFPLATVVLCGVDGSPTGEPLSAASRS